MHNTQVIICSVDLERPKKNPHIKALCESGYLRHEPKVNTASEQSLARSCLAEYALGKSSDVVLGIDTNIKFGFEDCHRVITRARETRGIAAGFYPHPKMKYNVHLRGTHTTQERLIQQTFEIGPNSTMGPQLVDAIGTGFMAIHRDVFARIPIKFPYLRTPLGLSRAAWFHQHMIPIKNGSFWLSSDHSFCFYAREAGCVVEGVPSVAVGHREPWWRKGEEPSSGVISIPLRQPSIHAMQPEEHSLMGSPGFDSSNLQSSFVDNNVAR